LNLSKTNFVLIIKSFQDYFHYQEVELLKEPAGLYCLLISYSGSVDSTLLAVLAQRALNEKVKSILFDAHMSHEGQLMMQQKLQVNSVYLATNAFPYNGKGKFQENSPTRCYICKNSLPGCCGIKLKSWGFQMLLME
jgi:PP-loop superfamily ATP-utilizing enzyme